MKLQAMLGVNITDDEVMRLVKEAYEHNQPAVRLPRGEGFVMVRLPRLNSKGGG